MVRVVHCNSGSLILKVRLIRCTCGAVMVPFQYHYQIIQARLPGLRRCFVAEFPLVLYGDTVYYCSLGDPVYYFGRLCVMSSV